MFIYSPAKILYFCFSRYFQRRMISFCHKHDAQSLSEMKKMDDFENQATKLKIFSLISIPTVSFSLFLVKTLLEKAWRIQVTMVVTSR